MRQDWNLEYEIDGDRHPRGARAVGEWQEDRRPTGAGNRFGSVGFEGVSFAEHRGRWEPVDDRRNKSRKGERRHRGRNRPSGRPHPVRRCRRLDLGGRLPETGEGIQMRLSKSWIIASNDFAIFLKNRNFLYSILIVPLLVSVLFPAVVAFAGRNGGRGIPAAQLPVLLPAFAFFYLILAGFIPTSIASYSIVGEKVEKCLEPLLATPTTDGEILLGKGISAFLPPIAAILGGSAVLLLLMALVTRGTPGYDFFPNWNAGIVLFLMVPLAAIMSVEWNVILSSRVSDVRVAMQLGALVVLPLGGIYVGGELNVIPLGDTSNLLIIVAILLVVDLLLLYVARATFRGEEILTKWR